MRALAVVLLMLAACDGNVDGDAPVEAMPAAITFDGAQADKIAHGKRLTYVLGCGGCHGDSLHGGQFGAEHPEYGPIYASNLTRAVAAFSDAQLEAIIRTGEHPVRKVCGRCLRKCITELQTRICPPCWPICAPSRPAGADAPATVQPARPQGHRQRKYKPAPDMIVDALKNPPADLGPGHALGRYMANTVCIECHGSNLKGRPNDTPDLVVASAYSRPEFEKFMITGIPVGGRKLTLMDGVARVRFSHFTRHERDALYDYLKARAEKAQ